MHTYSSPYTRANRFAFVIYDDTIRRTNVFNLHRFYVSVLYSGIGVYEFYIYYTQNAGADI